jgi:Smg protein|uniref:Protein Smg homolog n=1 Tax=mine drainage metagenome TaxID=410659 RepID=E6QPP3_9ZZZZ
MTQQSMFEILMYLFESYFDAGSYPEPDKLSRKLTAAGFEGDEITEALSWLSALQQQSPDSYPVNLEHSGIRHFASLELESVSFEARQFLVFTHQQQMISAVEREIIMDRAVALRQKNLGLDKLKLIMLMVLWNRHKELDALLIEELLTPLYSKQIH